jgi:hypothetical protein
MRRKASRASGTATTNTVESAAEKASTHDLPDLGVEPEDRLGTALERRGVDAGIGGQRAAETGGEPGGHDRAEDGAHRPCRWYAGDWTRP